MVCGISTRRFKRSIYANTSGALRTRSRAHIASASQHRISAAPANTNQPRIGSPGPGPKHKPSTKRQAQTQMRARVFTLKWWKEKQDSMLQILGTHNLINTYSHTNTHTHTKHVHVHATGESVYYSYSGTPFWMPFSRCVV